MLAVACSFVLKRMQDTYDQKDNVVAAVAPFQGCQSEIVLLIGIIDGAAERRATLRRNPERRRLNVEILNVEDST